MPSVGFEGALGQQAMADSIRQRIMDALAQKQIEHGMSVEDQKLALEKQRFDQEAADRALLRQQQGATFNAKIGQETAANMGPGRTVISPAAATNLAKLDPSLVPLMSADTTLPSRQFSGGASMPAPDVSPQLADRFISGTLRPLMPDAAPAPTAPTVTNQSAVP